MSEMIEREGEVIGFAQGETLVRVEQAAACSACGSRGSCASGAASGQVIQVQLAHAAKLGDHLTVSMPVASLALAAVIGYLLPPVMLLLGAIFASAMWASDVAAVVGAAAGFAGGLVIARTFSVGTYGRRLTPTCRSADIAAASAAELTTKASFAPRTGEHA